MFPDTLLTEIPTAVATELLDMLAKERISVALFRWSNGLRTEVANAQAQDSMFEDMR